MTILLYHITSLSNLSTLLQCGELLSKNRLQRSQTQYASIAYEHIQHRRASITIPYEPGGNLHDYVPFYFAARSPMLFAIHKGSVQGYGEGQQSILHLVTSTEAIADAALDFVFSDGHAVVSYTNFYNDLALLPDVIDWDIMRAKVWRDTHEDGDRKRRRQAEFLVYQSVPWSLIRGIGVYSKTIADQVTQTLKNYGQTTDVRTLPTDYYY